jgi:hypothetical protein
MPGDSDYRAPAKTVASGGAKTAAKPAVSGGTKSAAPSAPRAAPSAPSWTGADYANIAAAALQAGSSAISIFSGAPKQQARAARDALAAARATAGATATNAAAQVEIERIRAETARLQSQAPAATGGSKLPLYIGLVGGGIALLTILAVLILRK